MHLIVFSVLNYFLDFFLFCVYVSVSTGWPEEVFKSSEDVWWDDPWPVKQRPLDLTTNGIWDHLRSLASPWEQLHSQVRLMKSLTLSVQDHVNNTDKAFVKLEWNQKRWYCSLIVCWSPVIWHWGTASSLQILLFGSETTAFRTTNIRYLNNY